VFTVLSEHYTKTPHLGPGLLQLCWSKYSSLKHTAMQTTGHSSTDISVIRDTQRPWSFVHDLRRDEIRGWWWWWWW